MNAPEMHYSSAGAPQPTCRTCGEAFVQKRTWAAFCSTRCRNAFHQAERRKEAIRAKALDLYQALAKIAQPNDDPAAFPFDLPHCTEIARAAIKGLNPPVEPKDLLKP